MDDLNQEDLEIKKLMGPYRLKKPPASLFKDFDTEVLEKIKAPVSTMPWGLVVSVSLALAFLFALALIFFTQLRPETKLREAQILSQSSDRIIVQASQEEQEEEEQVLYEELARDLLILELLGEDEGLLDSFEGIETDVELLLPTNSPL